MDVLISGLSSVGEELAGFSLVLRAESDLVVDAVHIILDILARESAAHVIEGVGVSAGAGLLQPPEGALDAVVPNWVLVLAALSIWEGCNLDAFFLPVGTATASLVSTLLVA
jgi:hypothetical protein